MPSTVAEAVASGEPSARRAHRGGEPQSPRPRRACTSSRSLGPKARAEVVAGRELPARWDPRVGPDRERSGGPAFGRGRLNGIAEPDEVLAVTTRTGGVIELGSQR